MKKYYKIDVSNLFRLRIYGIKKDLESPASLDNFLNLEDIYESRYPQLMEEVQNLQYLNLRLKDSESIPKSKKDFYKVPEYFLVSEGEHYDYFEYKELLTGISFLIPQEVYEKIAGKRHNLRKEINELEIVELYNDDYIERINGLFNLCYDKDQKDNAKVKLLSKIKNDKNSVLN